MNKVLLKVLLAVLAALITISCGPAQVPEESIRRSQRFYDAAYIAWRDQGDNLTAIRHLTRSVEEDPGNDKAQYLLGTIRLGRGEFEAAEKHLAAAMELRKENNPSGLVETQNSLGVLYIQTKRLPEAVALLEAASSEVLNREPWLAFGNLGWAYTELGEYDKAIDAIKRALIDQPMFCVGLYRIGHAYYLKGDYEEAKQRLINAVSIEDGACNRMQEAHHLLGMTYVRENDLSMAIDSFDTCIDISPKSEVGMDCARAREGL